MHQAGLGTPPLFAQGFQGLTQLVDHAASLGQQFDARLSQAEAPRGAHQQLQSQPLFQLAHTVSQRRLREVQPQGGLLEASGFGDIDEGLEAKKIDAQTGLPGSNPEYSG
jgi:hypothetical protein